MAGRREMDGKRLQREMMERRRDGEVDESARKEAEQQTVKKNTRQL